MTCACGSTDIREVTDQDDRQQMFLCALCGSQGPERTFRDPPEPPADEPQPSFVDRCRLRIAEFIAPK